MLQPRLDQLQAETIAMLDDARVLLTGERAAAGEAIAAVRWRLARKLREYQVFKHSRIFDPAITSGSPSLEEAGRQLKIDCIAGGEHFRRYVRRWTGVDLAEQWAEFEAATIEIDRNLRDHLAAEGLQVRLLLSRADLEGE